jgi:hypothetical protein
VKYRPSDRCDHCCRTKLAAIARIAIHATPAGKRGPIGLAASTPGNQVREGKGE